MAGRVNEWVEQCLEPGALFTLLLLVIPLFDVLGWISNLQEQQQTNRPVPEGRASNSNTFIMVVLVLRIRGH